MAKSKLVEANEKLAEGVASGYRKIEEGVVDGYRKIEEGAVGGVNRIADKFVDNFLTKNGETVEEAKVRLAREQKERGQRHSDMAAANLQKMESAKLEAERKAGVRS